MKCIEQAIKRLEELKPEIEKDQSGTFALLLSMYPSREICISDPLTWRCIALLVIQYFPNEKLLCMNVINTSIYYAEEYGRVNDIIDVLLIRANWLCDHNLIIGELADLTIDQDLDKVRQYLDNRYLFDGFRITRCSYEILYKDVLFKFANVVQKPQLK